MFNSSNKIALCGLTVVVLAEYTHRNQHKSHLNILSYLFLKKHENKGSTYLYNLV